jgi:dTDP-4-amino-4,6-dideoxygalactose transaminase
MEVVPFLDLKRQMPAIREQIQDGWEEVIARTAFAGGPFVETFEKAFASYCDVAYASGVNSGTSALHLAMLALGIGPGDEVILPGNTFIATAWGVSYCGATPVFVDCDEYDNIDPAAAEAAITPQTKAIIGVHLYGQPCDVLALQNLARKHNLYFLEDAAQAHGARYDGKRVGGFGEMAAFSFYPGKNLGAWGEGGGITSNNQGYIEHINRLRNHGSEVRYYHDELGFNMRMDGLQAVVLHEKLRHLDGWNAARRLIAKQYLDNIENEWIQTPKVRPEAESVWHLFVVRTPDRDHFMKHMETCGVQTALHYPVPCHMQKAYAHLGYQQGSLPQCERLAAHCVSLPIFAELRPDEVDRVIEAVNAYKK